MDLSSQVLQSALARALLEAIPKETQKEIFANALETHLYYAKTDSTENKISTAFKKALDDATHELAKELLNEPANKEKIKASFQRAIDEEFETGTLMKQMVQKMSQRFY